MNAGLRYAYVTNGLTGHRLADALRMLADCGYDGVALTLDHVHFDPLEPRLRSRAHDLRVLLDALGLDRVIETGGRYVLDPRRKHHPTLLSDRRERRLELTVRAIEVASELHAPAVSIWSGAAPTEVEPPIVWDRLLEGCERILAAAERHGIMVAFEPEPGMLVDRLDGFERLARDLGDPAGLGITLDLGHCVCLEPDPVAECVRRAAPRLVHVHADDMRRGVHEHLMFGEGELDLGAALGALGEVGYRGLVAVELSRHAHAAAEVVPTALARLRATEPRPSRAATEHDRAPAPGSAPTTATLPPVRREHASASSPAQAGSTSSLYHGEPPSVPEIPRAPAGRPWGRTGPRIRSEES